MPPKRSPGHRMAARKSAIFPRTRRAIIHVAGYADRPDGVLKASEVISRSRLLDEMNASPESVQALRGESLPVIDARYKGSVQQDRRRKMAIIGAAMHDLGFHKFSKHAWSRNPPCEGVA